MNAPSSQPPTSQPVNPNPAPWPLAAKIPETVSFIAIAAGITQTLSTWIQAAVHPCSPVIGTPAAARTITNVMSPASQQLKMHTYADYALIVDREVVATH